MVEALLNAYPQAVQEKNSDGSYPLHLAARNQASVGVVKALLAAYAAAAQEKDSWAANKRFKSLKFKFKFPIARIFELFRARSRLYRSQILQVHTRWKALAEIYTMHSFAPFSNLKFFVKNC